MAARCVGLPAQSSWWQPRNRLMIDGCLQVRGCHRPVPPEPEPASHASDRPRAVTEAILFDADLVENRQMEIGERGRFA